MDPFLLNIWMYRIYGGGKHTSLGYLCVHPFYLAFTTIFHDLLKLYSSLMCCAFMPIAHTLIIEQPYHLEAGGGLLHALWHQGCCWTPNSSSKRHVRYMWCNSNEQATGYAKGKSSLWYIIFLYLKIILRFHLLAMAAKPSQ